MKKKGTRVGQNLGLGPGETEMNKLEKQDPHLYHRKRFPASQQLVYQ